MNTIGLRFFTIYGPFGRPDMFIPKIIDKIKKKKTIELFNNGNHFRDFTFVGDVSNIILKMIQRIGNKKLSNTYNICNGKSYNIKKIIRLIEKETKLKLKYKNKPFQMGDMYKTFGSNSKLKKNYKIKKFTSFEKGIKYTIQEDFY